MGATKPPQTKSCLDAVLRTGGVCRMPACKSTQEGLKRCGKWSVMNSLKLRLLLKVCYLYY